MSQADDQGQQDDSLSPTLDTTGLYLQFTNVDTAQTYWNLYNPTGGVYAIWTAPTPLGPWSVATEVWPTNADVQLFTLPASTQGCLFLRAQQWDGVAENGNTTPDWWLWTYFGNPGLAMSDSTLDSSGTSTLLSDYLDNQDPNVITFTVSATNHYVNQSAFPVQVNVTQGQPFYFAVLVDDTNFAGATWNTYASSNITANLGTNQGWHDVCVALRGLPSSAQQTWQTIMLNLNSIPPLLVITNPVTTTLASPYIQLQGYANHKLLSLTYSISNAICFQTNLAGFLTGCGPSSSGSSLITNYFQCFDVGLTNGLNLVTLTATDLAGNQTVTPLSFTLDYSSDTNPPVVQITWPQDGTQVSGTNFTLDGQLDDPTETVSGFITDTNGDTNAVSGLVERNGTFWVQGIPLNPGTNSLTLTITDATGNTTVTNISVIQTPITLAMDPVTPDSQLWQPTVNLTGEISDPTYAVWVNGVKGTNNGDGTWSANNVPTTSGGTASFTMTGYAPNEQQPDGSYGN